MKIDFDVLFWLIIAFIYIVGGVINRIKQFNNSRPTSSKTSSSHTRRPSPHRPHSKTKPTSPSAPKSIEQQLEDFLKGLEPVEAAPIPEEAMEEFHEGPSGYQEKTIAPPVIERRPAISPRAASTTYQPLRARRPLVNDPVLSISTAEEATLKEIKKLNTTKSLTVDFLGSVKAPTIKMPSYANATKNPLLANLKLKNKNQLRKQS